MNGILLGWPLLENRPQAGFLRDDRSPTPPSANVPVTDATEAHCLVVAPTGAGKGRGLVIPNLLQWPHSAIVVDIKGEAAQATARYRRSLGQRVVVLDPFRRVSDGSDALNPLDWLSGNADELADNATTLSETLTGHATSTKEPFWDHLANDFVAGLIALASSERDPAKRSLSAVFDMLTHDDPEYALAVRLDVEKDMHPFAYRQIAGYLHHETDKVRPSVRSTAQQHLRIFVNPLVRRVMSQTTFALDELEDGAPVTVYLVLPANRLLSHAPVLRVWLTVLLGCIAERKAQPIGPTLFVADELAQIGALPTILTALTLLRGYGLRVMAIVQSIAQIKALWPAEHQTILDNCGLIAAFGQTRPAMANPVSEMLGDFSAHALMQLRSDQLAIGRPGLPTSVLRRLDYLSDSLFWGRFDPNPLYGRTNPRAR